MYNRWVESDRQLEEKRVRWRLKQMGQVVREKHSKEIGREIGKH